MKYFVIRDGQQYGPYTLAELQRYVQQGNVALTDQARSEAMDRTVSVQEIVGNIAVPQAAASPSSYGQVPVYGGSGAAAAAQPALAAEEGPMPIGLHWGIVLLLTIVTFQIFSLIWLLVEAAFVHRLRTGHKPLIWYSIGITLILLSGFFSGLGREYLAFLPLLQLVGAGFLIAGHYSIKFALEEYYNAVEPYGLYLSGGMTFFFNVFYFQYHFRKIREWKQTGSLVRGAARDGVISMGL
jgi:hypothetical protein